MKGKVYGHPPGAAVTRNNNNSCIKTVLVSERVDEREREREEEEEEEERGDSMHHTAPTLKDCV